MENGIQRSTFEPGDFDYPSDVSGHNDIEYDPINVINSSDKSQDYIDTIYALINEINSDDESQDQKELSQNLAPNMDFLDGIEIKKTAEDASAIFPLAINTQTEAEKYLIR